MIGIEYVCSGNHARSPMTEVIAKEYVQQKGLAEKVNIYSSGSALHPNFDQGTLLEHRLMVVMLSLQGEIFQGRIADMARRAVAESVNNEALNQCYKYAEQAEEQFREATLLEVGLLADGRYKQPTMERTDVDLILTMAQINTDQVQEIYGRHPHFDPVGTKYCPWILSLNTYAGLPGEVENPFCQSLPAYQRVRDHLMLAVPKTIDKAVKDFSLRT